MTRLKGSYGHLEGGWIGATPIFNSFSIKAWHKGKFSRYATMVNLPIWQVKSKQDKIQVVNNKKGVTDRKARGDKDVFPSSSFLGEYVSLEGCEFQTQDATNGLTLFSDEPRTKARSTFLYRSPSRRNPEPLQQAWSTTHKRIGSSQAPQLHYTKVASKLIQQDA